MLGSDKNKKEVGFCPVEGNFLAFFFSSFGFSRAFVGNVVGKNHRRGSRKCHFSKWPLELQR